MTEGAPKNLFGTAQIAETDLRAFARFGLRKKTNPLTQRDLRKARAKPLHEIARFRAPAPSLGLFGSAEDVLSDLEVEQRQLVAAITEINAELTQLNAELAPWYDAARSAAEWHTADVEERGFLLGGDQAATRKALVARLDDLRQRLAPKFKAAGEARNRLRSAQVKLRSVQAEIKIITGRQKSRMKQRGAA